MANLPLDPNILIPGPPSPIPTDSSADTKNRDNAC